MQAQTLEPEEAVVRRLASGRAVTEHSLARTTPEGVEARRGAFQDEHPNLERQHRHSAPSESRRHEKRRGHVCVCV